MISTVLAPLVLVLAALVGGCANDAPRPLAITFDDGPVTRFYSHASPWHRQLVVDSLTAALARFEAPATVFAIGSQAATPEGADLLRRWMAHGVTLGNHTMNHPNFNTLGYEAGVEEMAAAAAVLAPLAAEAGTPVRYFRFPFLAEGRRAADKAAWQAHLHAAGLENARVTITTDDWKFDEEYARYEEAEDWAARYEVGQAYLAHVREAVAFWDSVAVELFARPVRHVLMLHANRINRDYLGQILADLDAQGFSFVTLDEAYRDPLYQEPDTWVAETGTSFLENLKQTRILAADP